MPLKRLKPLPKARPKVRLKQALQWLTRLQLSPKARQQVQPTAGVDLETAEAAITEGATEAGTEAGVSESEAQAAAEAGETQAEEAAEEAAAEEAAAEEAAEDTVVTDDTTVVTSPNTAK